MTMSAAIIALVVAIAGMMFPAIADKTSNFENYFRMKLKNNLIINISVKPAKFSFLKYF